MKADRVLGWVRRVLLLGVLGLCAYAWRRFDVVALPEGALSPLHGIHPGDRLLVDRRARPEAGEADWLFRGADGALLLGRSKAPPAGHTLGADELWLEFEREVPGLQDSRARGPVSAGELEGRVVLVFPR